MARNDSLNIRLNAQANITNIDRIKKELSQVMDNISLDKSVETSLNKTLERMTKLQKVFENISKKSVFNDKDIQKINAVTEELENNVKQIGITMKTINMNSLVKSTTQYKTLMEDINKQTLEIKQNFKNLTGSDFDKEIKNIDTLKNNKDVSIIALGLLTKISKAFMKEKESIPFLPFCLNQREARRGQQLDGIDKVAIRFRLRSGGPSTGACNRKGRSIAEVSGQ